LAMRWPRGAIVPSDVVAAVPVSAPFSPPSATPRRSNRNTDEASAMLMIDGGRIGGGSFMFGLLCRRSLPMPIEKSPDQWGPQRNGVGGIDKVVSLAAERRHQVIFGVAAGAGVGFVHAPGQGRSEERVVLDIDPQHRRPRRAAEIRRRLDQFVGCTIVVGL